MLLIGSQQQESEEQYNHIYISLQVQCINEIELYACKSCMIPIQTFLQATDTLIDLILLQSDFMGP